MSYYSLSSTYHLPPIPPVQTDYPFDYISSNWSTKPSTFTNLCIPPDCPNFIDQLPHYEDQYTNKQFDQQALGLQRYNSNRQATLNPNIPLYTSNMRPANSFIRYDTNKCGTSNYAHFS